MKHTWFKSRWWIVFGAILIQISLGAVYIWSVFETPLKIHFPTWTEKQATLPAKAVLLFFALAMIVGGRMQDAIGPRKTALTGGICLGSGLMLASATGFITNPVWALGWLTVTYALLGGIGIGVAYVCPIASCIRWFPDKRGFVVGLAVAGFGAGAFFFAPLAKGLIAGGSYILINFSLFDLPQAGLFGTFFVLGFIFCVAVSVGALFLKKPPAEDKDNPQNLFDAAKCSSPTDYQPSEMLKTKYFWLLWLTYFFGCCSGLMVIMKTAPMWFSKAFMNCQVSILESEYLKAASQGAVAVSILSIFNAGGRIVWGQLSDRLGRMKTLVIVFLACAAGLAALIGFHTYPLFLVSACLVGFCFGGFLALYPAVTAEVFGQRHIGANYGWMFTAFGLGGVAGPWLAATLIGSLKKITVTATPLQAQKPSEVAFWVGNYQTALIICVVLCLLSAVLLGSKKLWRPPYHN